MRTLFIAGGLFLLCLVIACEDKGTGEVGQGYYVDTLYVVEDARVESARPDVTLGLGGDLIVGLVTYSGGLQYKYNTFVKLPPMPDSMIREQVFYARLVLRYTGAVATLPDEIVAHEVLEDWSEALVTWNNQPAVNASSFAADSIANHQLQIDVYEFYNDTLPHFGVMLAADGVEKYFSSSEQFVAGARPMVIIKQRNPYR